jgi:hypothetical protein
VTCRLTQLGALDALMCLSEGLSVARFSRRPPIIP